MRTFKNLIKPGMLVALGLTCFTFPATAQSDDTQDADTPSATEFASDTPRKLDQITVRGVRGAPAPKTGRVIMDVSFTYKTQVKRITSARGAKRRTRSQRLLNTQRYGLSFARVEFNSDGSAQLVPPSAQKRFFRISSGAATHDDFAVDLPEGYYVLAEIRYDATRFNVGSVDFTNPNFTSTIGFASNGNRRVEYCIAKKTFAFEVVNGQTSYLGNMVLLDPGDNPAKDSKHIPIAGFSQDVDHFVSKTKWSKRNESEILGTPIRKIAFNADEPICRIKGSKSVKGWESVSAEGSET